MEADQEAIGVNHDEERLRSDPPRRQRGQSTRNPWRRLPCIFHARRDVMERSGIRVGIRTDRPMGNSESLVTVASRPLLVKIVCSSPLPAGSKRRLFRWPCISPSPTPPPHSPKHCALRCVAGKNRRYATPLGGSPGLRPAERQRNVKQFSYRAGGRSAWGKVIAPRPRHSSLHPPPSYAWGGGRPARPTTTSIAPERS